MDAAAVGYTPSDVFTTFPFPRGWTTDPALDAAGRAYCDFRADFTVMNDEGLTKTLMSLAGVLAGELVRTALPIRWICASPGDRNELALSVERGG